jgi:hypothetical protein
MSKDFFTVENLADYRGNPKIVAALDGRAILNFSEFLQWFTPSESSTRAKTLWKRSAANIILSLLVTKVCEGKIELEYGRRVMENLPQYGFDLLVILDRDYLQVKERSPTSALIKRSSEKLDCVLGFMIVEKGECGLLKDHYSLNLICNRAQHPGRKRRYTTNKMRSSFEKLKGSLLIGAYIHCAKKMGHLMGLLEVGNGYTNLAAFFLYSKMGFTANVEMLGPDCFPSYYNLPMSVMLENFSHEYIIDLASGTKKFTDFEDKTGIINLVPEPGNKEQQIYQKGAAIFCNLLYQIPYILNGKFILNPRREPTETNVLKSIGLEFKEYLLQAENRPEGLIEEYTGPNGTLNFFVDALEERKQNLMDYFKKAAKLPPKKSPSPHDVSEAELTSANPSQVAKVVREASPKTMFQRLSQMASRMTSRQSAPVARPPSRSSASRTRRTEAKPPSRAKTAKVIGRLSNTLSKMGMPSFK